MKERATMGRTGLEREVLLKNTVITVVMMVLATIASKGFFHYSKNTTSVAIIYVLVVMLVARYTTGYVPGILASVVGVICVNYVFTYPYMHLNFTIDG